jgi:hypothetical protein
VDQPEGGVQAVSTEDAGPPAADESSLRFLAYAGLRYFAGFALLSYGFAKLNGAQFTILDSELDKPMGQVSGFWLTWYYFGYSKAYGSLVALAQILGAVLLFFRRTTLLAACLLLPLVLNIVAVNVFYRIDPGALLAALAIGGALLGILAMHRQELLDLFWRRQNRLFPNAPPRRAEAIAKGWVRALLILAPAFFTYWVANYNNRRPTPIDGPWEVVEAQPTATPGSPVPVKVFFERNRAWLCVFKHSDGSYRPYRFEVEPSRRTVEIRERRGSPQLFTGRYDPARRRLTLTTSSGDGEQKLVLKR